MTIPLLFVLYRLFKLEVFILKTGFYFIEWVGAKQAGRVVTRP